MKKLILTAIVLAAGLIQPGYGDDFEDFIQACARISSNYNRALQSPGTRFNKEFQTSMEHLKHLSRNLQSVIRKKQLGQDFDFPQLIREVEQIYLGALIRSKNKTSDKLYNHSESPVSMLRILTDDVKALRKMEFTTEDGGSIKSSLETRRKLDEFRRLSSFFRKNYRAASGYASKTDVSLKRIFSQRQIRMSALANILMQTVKEKYPDSLTRYNLQTETMHLNKCFDALEEIAVKKKRSNRSRGHAKNGRTTASRRLDGLDTSSAVISEINLCLRNIDEQVVLWEQSGFQSDEPIRQEGKDHSWDAAAPLLGKNAAQDYHAMDRKALNALLLRRRQAILRSNSAMDGFDKNSEKMFLLTLSREQKRQYNEYVRDFQEQGYSSGQAIRSAVMKIHTQIQMQNQVMPEKETILVLKALDKEEERRKEKNEVKFKLERGNP